LTILKSEENFVLFTNLVSIGWNVELPAVLMGVESEMPLFCIRKGITNVFGGNYRRTMLLEFGSCISIRFNSVKTVFLADFQRNRKSIGTAAAVSVSSNFKRTHFRFHWVNRLSSSYHFSQEKTKFSPDFWPIIP
jgi:hypothetical protein